VRPAGPTVEGAARRRRHGGVRLDDAGGSLGAPVDRPTITETTALGAVYLAYPDPAAFAARGALDRRFTAAMDETTLRR
jgi:hypothetical protein